MNKPYPFLEVKVWGDLACFTRPDMKVERVSYPVMTPSAAKGILEAIYWVPEIYWQIREIHVLRPIRYLSILRNEVKEKVPTSSIMRWEVEDKGFYAEESRAQRHTLALRDVAYIIKADVILKPHVNDNIAKYRNIFRRRVNRGQSYHTPYLGCREFSGYFAAPNGTEQPISTNEDLGLMLFQMDFAPGSSGSASPIFFSAQLASGILKIPLGV